jgi:DNA-binding PadR family transcriptional regulator
MRANQIDEILASPPRLALMASLADGRWRTFMELKRDTGLADGNLHVQTRKMTDAGYLELRKLPHGRRTRTTYRVTELGSTRFRLHVQLLQSVLQRGEGTIRPRLARDREDDAQVW